MITSTERLVHSIGAYKLLDTYTENGKFGVVFIHDPARPNQNVD